jgi:hypothetical protein
VPISAVDTVNLAFEHTRRQLFRPFRFWQWVRLAFVGLLAGELGSGGNFNLPRTTHPGTIPSLGEGFPKIDPAILASVITVLIITGFVVFLVLTYVSSVMRFILFDGVLTSECHIGAGWSRRQGNGWHYFLWQLVLLLATFVGFVLLIVLPAAFAFGMGWFSPPRAHVVQLVLTGILVVAVFLIYMIAVAVVHVFTKDFVIPQMAMEGITAFEGWRRLLPMIRGEEKGYFIYIVLKIALSVVAAIAIGIVTAILALILAVPVIGIVATAVVATKSGALTWNVLTITFAVIAGLILLGIFFFLVSLITVPVIVFFPAYSIYFFAGRYRPLSMALYPASAQSAASGTPPRFTPPPLSAT